MHKNDRIIVMLGLIVIIVALIGAAVGGGPEQEEDIGEDKLKILDLPIKNSPVKTQRGTLTENSDETLILSVNESYVTKVVIELNWLDEAPATGPGSYENQPDSFNFTVYTPWNEIFESDTVQNPIGQAGLIREEIIVPEDGIKSSAAFGEWRVVIFCQNCGNQVPLVSIIDLREIEDDSNDWALTFQYWFHTNN